MAMDLILWRHAEAQDGSPDLERELTPKGRKQARHVAQWLLKRLPEDFSVVSSPAARAVQTAEALERKFRTVKSIAPGASVKDLLAAAEWPEGKGAVVLVGHQPDLGQAAAHLLGDARSGWHLKKGAFCWIASKDYEVRLVAAMSPDLV